MKLYKLKMIRAAFFGPALLLLASCSSYQYAGYDNDGIYSSDNREAVAANEEQEDSYGESQYYKQLFAEQSAQYDQLPQEGMIFTNIDAYSSTGPYDESAFVDDALAYQGGNAPWGEEVDEISINIYPSMSPFFGIYASPYPYVPHYMRGFYNPYRGYGYGGMYHHRWSPWGYGNYGYGYGFYRPFGMPPWGWGTPWDYHNPYRYRYGYGNSGYAFTGYGYSSGYTYNNRNVSYNRTGRNAVSRSNTGIERSSSIVRSSRRDSYTNSSSVRADRTRSALSRTSRSLSDNNNRTYSTRTTRVASPKTENTRRSTATRSTTARSNNNSTQTRATRTTRSNSTPQVRRSTSTSRSSGTVRSTTTRTRSSGTRSSGTRSSGSRGGRGN